jgi:hypothetical protein
MKLTIPDSCPNKYELLFGCAILLCIIRVMLNKNTSAIADLSIFFISILIGFILTPMIFWKFEIKKDKKRGILK